MAHLGAMAPQLTKSVMDPDARWLLCQTQDVQWSDIDYMKLHLDWTYDADGNFPSLPDIVNDLHNNNQKYVIIVVSQCLLFFSLLYSDVLCRCKCLVVGVNSQLSGCGLILTASHLQATLSKLLTYCVLRPTQPFALCEMGNL